MIFIGRKCVELSCTSRGSFINLIYGLFKVEGQGTEQDTST